MKAEIESRFSKNLSRVEHLIAAHEVVSSSGGHQEDATDVLRAAVIFLHAALEDLLRSLEEWKLPLADARHLSDVPLEGKKPREKFTLGDLVAHRGRTVDEVIRQSVSANLERSNYNDVGEMVAALHRVGVSEGVFSAEFKGQLAAMSSRRHLIAHRADRRSVDGQDVIASLMKDVVEEWHRAVWLFGRALLTALSESEEA